MFPQNKDITSHKIKSIFGILLAVLITVFLVFHSIFTAPAIILIPIFIFFIVYSTYKPVSLTIFAVLVAMPLRPLINATVGMFTFEGLALIFLILSLSLKNVFKKNKKIKLELQSSDKLFILLFVACLITYFQNPALPSFAWFGQSTTVSGFQSWFKLFIGFIVFFVIRIIIDDKNKLSKFLQIVIYTSFSFSLILLFSAFTNSYLLLYWLQHYGVYIASVGDIHRFVILQHFGFISLLGYFFPLLFNITNKKIRLIFLFHGVICILMSGNRANIISISIAFLISLLLLKRTKQFLICLLIGASMFLLGFGIIKSGSVSVDHPILRIYSLIDKNLAYETDASATQDWRYDLWDITWLEIKNKPFGHGFSKDQISEVLTYRSGVGYISRESRILHMIRKGDTHNCFLSTAYLFGLPAAILYSIWTIYVIIQSSYRSLKTSNNYSRIFYTFCFVIFTEKMIHFIAAGDLLSPRVFLLWGLGITVFSLAGKIELIESKKTNI